VTIRRRGLRVRTCLAVVAAVALVMGSENLFRRPAYCLERGNHHRDVLDGLGTQVGPDPEGHATLHRGLARRFALAADRPWGAIPAEPGEVILGPICIPMTGFEAGPGGSEPGR